MAAGPEIALPQEYAQANAQREARKVFRLQVAINLISNEDLHKYAASGEKGAAKAHALIERATEVALAYMNED